MVKRKLGYRTNNQTAYSLVEPQMQALGYDSAEDVSSIQHAYVKNAYQKHGVGKNLLSHLCNQATRPVLVGTWADAT